MSRSTWMARGVWLVAVLLAGSACTSQAEPAPKLAKAPPGRYVTVAGAGLDPEAPGSIDAPVDLAEATGGGLLFLGEHGAVHRIGKDGRVSEYARGPGSDGPLGPITALSMARQQDGSLMIAVTGEAGDKIMLYKVAPGRQAVPSGEFTVAETESVHLVPAPDGSVLLLKDGKFVGGEGLGKPDIPKGLDKIIDADTDGDRLLIVTGKELIWARNGEATNQVKLSKSLNAEDDGVIAPDSLGGIYFSNGGHYVGHVQPSGEREFVLRGWEPELESCGDAPKPSGQTPGDREPVSIFGVQKVRDQVYVADGSCARVLAIGLPVGRPHQ